MSNSTSISALSLLDQQLRSDIFRLLHDDPLAAVNLARAFPIFINEIGLSVFREYRASRPYQMQLFLAALVRVPPLARFVEVIILTSPFDDNGQSGLWEWLFALVRQPVSLQFVFGAAGAQTAANGLNNYFASKGLTLVNGVVSGVENLLPNHHHGILLSQVLPRLRRNVVEMEIPRAWGIQARTWALANFPNMRQVRMV